MHQKTINFSLNQVNNRGGETMTKVFILGVGVKKFGKYENMSLEQIGRESVINALEDASIDIDEIENVFCGNVFGGTLAGQRVLNDLTTTGVPVININNACASSSTALNLAYNSIKSGMNDFALAIGVENLSALGSGVLPTPPHDIDAESGLTLPAIYAMRAKRYTETYGIDYKLLAEVAVKNRIHGSKNPYAHFYQKPNLTKEQVLDSMMIAEPITLLQSSPKSDGAASVVLCSERVLKRYKEKAVEMIASVVVSGKFKRGYHDMALPDEPTVESIERAYKIAGVSAEDIDVVELHDAFSIAEVLYTEALGFCEYGKGIEMLVEGRTYHDGDKPINVSGGLLSRGHAVGATGLAQVAEINWQLLGKAPGFQVKDPKVGLTLTSGGGISNFQNGTSVVNILSI
jgi:acetyl-CoA acetyltransferase